MLSCHRPKRRQKTERHEAGENVRFYAIVQLMINGSEAEIVLHFTERVFDFSLNHILLPESFRVAVRQVCTQKICPLVISSRFADLRPVEMPCKRVKRYILSFSGDGNRNHLPRPSCF